MIEGKLCKYTGNWFLVMIVGQEDDDAAVVGTHLASITSVPFYNHASNISFMSN